MRLRHKAGDPPWLPLVDTCYGAALYLFPNRFRNEYGDSIRQAFRDRCREVGLGRRGALRLLVLELAPDLLATFGREQMKAGIGDFFPRQVALLGVLCAALGVFVFYDSVTPKVLDQVVTVRNRTTDLMQQRAIDAEESRIQAVATKLATGGDPVSLGLAAWSHRSIAVRKESPYYAPDKQNEAFYHRSPEDASAEKARAATLEQAALDASFDAHAMARVADSCGRLAACDSSVAVTRLTRLDPGNAYGWLLAFKSARLVGDHVAMAATMRGLASADHFEAFEGPSVARLLSAEAAVGDDRAEWIRIVRTQAVRMGLLGALGDPVGSHCAKVVTSDAAEESDPDTVAACRSLIPLLARSTKLNVRMHGLRGLLAMSEDPAARTSAISQLRDLYWLSGAKFDGKQNSMTVGKPDLASAADAERWALAFAAGEGEVPSLRRWFVARGLSESAPANYEVLESFMFNGP